MIDRAASGHSAGQAYIMSSGILKIDLGTYILVFSDYDSIIVLPQIERLILARAVTCESLFDCKIVIGIEAIALEYQRSGHQIVSMYASYSSADISSHLSVTFSITANQAL